MYNLFSSFVQFILPLLIVFVVYCSIYCRLKNRPQSQHEQNNRRRRRTNIMIVLVSISFFLSWLPLNTLNTMLNFTPDLIEKYLGGQDTLVYGLANIFGLGNACINPVLYGFLNENFRKEYKSIYRKIPWTNISSVRRGSGSDQKFELRPLNSADARDLGGSDRPLVRLKSEYEDGKKVINDDPGVQSECGITLGGSNNNSVNVKDGSNGYHIHHNPASALLILPTGLFQTSSSQSLDERKLFLAGNLKHSQSIRLVNGQGQVAMVDRHPLLDIGKRTSKDSLSKTTSLTDIKYCCFAPSISVESKENSARDHHQETAPEAEQSTRLLSEVV